MAERAKNWCFTLTNYTSEDLAKIDDLGRDTANYLIYGKEKGKSDVPILRGYVQFNQQMRTAAVKKLLGGKRYYIGHQVGKVDQESSQKQEVLQ